MRRMLLLALVLTAAAFAALAPVPQAEATTYCSWECGECGLICPCEVCRGVPPFCVCT